MLFYRQNVEQPPLREEGLIMICRLWQVEKMPGLFVAQRLEQQFDCLWIGGAGG
jgi:hypothetical protein